MARNPAPWNWQDPVVNDKGRATPEFLAWLSQQLAVNTLASGAVPQSREINTGLGLTGGGDLSVDRTISLDADISDLNDVDTVTTPPIDGQALVWNNVDGEWVPGDVATSLEVDSEGTPVSTDVNTLNFTGTGVSVTDAGGGQVDIDITGGPTPDPAFAVQATGTGSSQVVTIPYSGLTEDDIIVAVNGVKYETDEYSIAGDDVTLTTNASGDSIEIQGPLGTVVSGSGGPAMMLYDISMGTPDFATVAQVGDGTRFAWSGNGTKGLNIQYTGANTGGAIIGGFTEPLVSSTGEWAVLGLQNNVGARYYGFAVGLYDSGLNRLKIIGSFSGGYNATGFMSYSGFSTRTALSEIYNAPSAVGPVWIHVKCDGTTMEFGVSKDGATPLWLFSEACATYVNNPTDLFFGGFFEDTDNVIGTSTTILCVDMDAATRVIGV